MNIQQLEYLLALDKFRHFAKAAEYCHVTQPTLSTMIQKLEEELGVKLFDRNIQPIQPTTAGQKVIKQALVVVQQTAMIKDIVSEEVHSVSGVFRMAVLPTIAPYLLPRFFKNMTGEYTEIDLRVQELQTIPTLEALKEGTIDAAIIAAYPLEDSLTGTTLFYEEYFGYVSPNESLFKHERIRTSEITGERLWLLDEGHCFRDQLMRFCQLDKVKKNQMAYNMGRMETFMRMVESGNGITFIPSLAIEQLSDEHKKLVRPFTIPKPTREIIFVTRKDFVRHSIANVLMDLVRKSVTKDMLTLKVDQKLV
jgi:Transcriptional regulator